MAIPVAGELLRGFVSGRLISGEVIGGVVTNIELQGNQLVISFQDANAVAQQKSFTLQTEDGNPVTEFTILTGQIDPQNSLGNDGSLYVNIATNSLFFKLSGSWEQIGSSGEAYDDTDLRDLISEQGVRLTAIETKNTEQDGRISQNENDIQALQNSGSGEAYDDTEVKQRLSAQEHKTSGIKVVHNADSFITLPDNENILIALFTNNDPLNAIFQEASEIGGSGVFSLVAISVPPNLDYRDYILEKYQNDGTPLGSIIDTFYGSDFQHLIRAGAEPSTNEIRVLGIDGGNIQVQLRNNELLRIRKIVHNPDTYKSNIYLDSIPFQEVQTEVAKQISEIPPPQVQGLNVEQTRKLSRLAEREERNPSFLENLRFSEISLADAITKSGASSFLATKTGTLYIAIPSSEADEHPDLEIFDDQGESALGTKEVIASNTEFFIYSHQAVLGRTYRARYVVVTKDLAVNLDIRDLKTQEANLESNLNANSEKISEIKTKTDLITKDESDITQYSFPDWFAGTNIKTGKTALSNQGLTNNQALIWSAINGANDQNAKHSILTYDNGDDTPNIQGLRNGIEIRKENALEVLQKILIPSGQRVTTQYPSNGTNHNAFDRFRLDLGIYRNGIPRSIPNEIFLDRNLPVTESVTLSAQAVINDNLEEVLILTVPRSATSSAPATLNYVHNSLRVATIQAYYVGNSLKITQLNVSPENLGVDGGYILYRASFQKTEIIPEQVGETVLFSTNNLNSIVKIALLKTGTRAYRYDINGRKGTIDFADGSRLSANPSFPSSVDNLYIRTLSSDLDSQVDQRLTLIRESADNEFGGQRVETNAHEVFLNLNARLRVLDSNGNSFVVTMASGTSPSIDITIKKGSSFPKNYTDGELFYLTEKTTISSTVFNAGLYLHDQSLSPSWRPAVVKDLDQFANTERQRILDRKSSYIEFLDKGSQPTFVNERDIRIAIVSESLPEPTSLSELDFELNFFNRPRAIRARVYIKIRKSYDITNYLLNIRNSLNTNLPLRSIALSNFINIFQSDNEFNYLLLPEFLDIKDGDFGSILRWNIETTAKWHGGFGTRASKDIQDAIDNSIRAVFSDSDSSGGEDFIKLAQNEIIDKQETLSPTDFKWGLTVEQAEQSQTSPSYSTGNIEEPLVVGVRAGANNAYLNFAVSEALDNTTFTITGLSQSNRKKVGGLGTIIRAVNQNSDNTGSPVIVFLADQGTLNIEVNGVEYPRISQEEGGAYYIYALPRSVNLLTDPLALRFKKQDGTYIENPAISGGGTPANVGGVIAFRGGYYFHQFLAKASTNFQARFTPGYKILKFVQDISDIKARLRALED